MDNCHCSSCFRTLIESRRTETLKLDCFGDIYRVFLFFRLPNGWRARYRRINGTYGSDHYPLIGWVVFPRVHDTEERGR